MNTCRRKVKVSGELVVLACYEVALVHEAQALGQIRILGG